MERDGDAPGKRGDHSLTSGLELAPQVGTRRVRAEHTAGSKLPVTCTADPAAVFTVVVVTQSVPDGCPSPTPSITVDGTKLPPTAVSVTLIVPYVEVVNE